MGARLRVDAALVTNGLLLVACFAWTAYGLAGVPAYPVLGWLPLPVTAVLAGVRLLAGHPVHRPRRAHPAVLAAPRPRVRPARGRGHEQRGRRAHG